MAGESVIGISQALVEVNKSRKHGVLILQTVVVRNVRCPLASGRASVKAGDIKQGQQDWPIFRISLFPSAH